MNEKEKRDYRSLLKRRYEENSLREMIAIDKKEGIKSSMKVYRLAAKMSKKDLNGMSLSEMEDYVNNAESRYCRLYVKQA